MEFDQACNQCMTAAKRLERARALYIHSSTLVERNRVEHLKQVIARARPTEKGRGLLHRARLLRNAEVALESAEAHARAIFEAVIAGEIEP